MKQILSKLFLSETSTIFSYLFNRQFKCGESKLALEISTVRDSLVSHTLAYKSGLAIHCLLQVRQKDLESLYQRSLATGSTRINLGELGFCLLGQISQSLAINFLENARVKKILGSLVCNPPLIWAVTNKAPLYNIPKGQLCELSDGTTKFSVFIAIENRLSPGKPGPLQGAWRPSESLFIYHSQQE